MLPASPEPRTPAQSGTPDAAGAHASAGALAAAAVATAGSGPAATAAFPAAAPPVAPQADAGTPPASGILWPAAALLALHVLVWLWCGTQSRSNLDGPGDMVEAYTWGMNLHWGNWKHPPLTGWITHLWFGLFPASDASFVLLACMTSALAVALTGVLARDWIGPRWVLPCMAAVMLCGSATVMTSRFNPNAVLLPLWLATLVPYGHYLRHGRRRDALWTSVLFGLAMMGKYFSGLWVIGLLLAAASHRDWRRRLNLRGLCWLAGPALLIALPNAIWLWQRDFISLQYAMLVVHPRGIHRMPAWTSYLLSTIGLALPGLIALALSTARRPRTTERASPGHALPDRASTERAASGPTSAAGTTGFDVRDLTHLVLVPFGTIVAVSAIVDLRTSPVWTQALPCLLTLYGAAWLARDARVPRLRRLGIVLAVVWTLLAIGAPLYWADAARHQAAAVTEPRAELAAALLHRARERVGIEPRWISGTPALAASVTFYGDSHPWYRPMWYLQDPDRVIPARLSDNRFGVFVCDMQDRECHDIVGRLAGEHDTVRVAKSVRGHDFAPVTYDLYWIIN